MENPPPATATPAPVVETGEDKTVAILSYLTIVGFIIALIMHGQKKTQLGAFHLRQTLGFVITGFAIGVVSVVPILGWLIAILSMPVFFVFWIMGLVSAIQGKLKPVPLVGEHFQKWFANTFN
ncbi:MAG TPA: hypothetical protein VEB66_00975 [Opitutaceae bacterium]|nr:hypothetical protein [Opitutaceae bacterium]